ncbi:hypothetical protein NFI96_008389 [Prochilodus magdalenae]|nr:hypothetical protein NFI96_008389 [Prochilodus magdalenae]
MVTCKTREPADAGLAERKEVRTGPANILLFIVLSCVSVCTVFLNLLVIISISHFKQLRTPTNLLILSLSVADLLVGLVVMPVNVMMLIDSCWYFGKAACSLYPIVIGVSMSGSICSLILIAADRFVAVMDPLLYSTRVTAGKTLLLIILSWFLSLLYAFVFLYFNDHLLPSQITTRCYGECVLYVKRSWMVINTVVFFLAPCSVILVLYSVIFNVARHQAKAVRAVLSVSSRKQRPKVTEIKAARTLGIVFLVHLACWMPHSVSVGNMTSLSVVWSLFAWLTYQHWPPVQAVSELMGLRWTENRPPTKTIQQKSILWVSVLWGSVMWAASSYGKCPVGGILWAAFCKWCPLGSVLWGSVLCAASNGHHPIRSIPWAAPVGGILWAAFCKWCPLGSVLWGGVLWAASNGHYPMGGFLWAAFCKWCPFGSVLWGRVLWAASCGRHQMGIILREASYGQRPVGGILGAASCGQRPVVGIKWASSYGRHPMGSVLWAASCGQCAVGSIL